MELEVETDSNIAVKSVSELSKFGLFRNVFFNHVAEKRNVVLALAHVEVVFATFFGAADPFGKCE